MLCVAVRSPELVYYLRMSTSDTTPVERRAMSAVCPFCSVRRRVWPSGRFELHAEVGRWLKWNCRGSGMPAINTTHDPTTEDD